jgi:two-component system, chemotaxis family, chemotaxis protein CheY
MAVNVLVVDDSGVMRSMIVKTLRLSGLQIGDIQQAADGQEGLNALSEHWIDLVLVDINMPVMDGEEMIDRMRENSEYIDTPVVVISTEGSEVRVERLREKGALFIHKPFTPEKIRDTIKELLGDGVFDGTEN